LAARTRLHFARFEFKYVLPQALRDELEKELRYFLEFDPFVENCEGHRYLVRSLYFDDPFYTAFYDKIEGLHTRAKFRVRTYTDAPGDGVPQFLEVKGRYNNLVLKHRTPLEDGFSLNVERGDDLVSKVLKGARPGDVSRQFEYELFRKRLRPVALVDYQRRPYVSRFDPEFRLTFDSELRGTLSRGLFPTGNDRSRMILPGFTVMEVKFRRHIPSWFHRLIQAYELRRVSMSKICKAMEILGLVEDPG